MAVPYSDGSRNFKTLESWNFGTVLMPLNTTYALIIRVENKIHIVHIACLLQLKYMSVQKQTPKYFQTGGRAPGAPVLDPPRPILNAAYRIAQVTDTHLIINHWVKCII